MTGVLVDIAAVRTRLACMRRIDVDDHDALGGGLLFALHLQVVVWPGDRQVPILTFHNLSCASDAGEVLEDYDRTGFKVGHECLGDARIPVVHPAGFS